MSLIGSVLGWLGVAERAFGLVKRVWPKAEPKEPPHPTWKDVEHMRRQEQSAARAYPPPTPPPPRPPPPPRKR